MLLFCWKWSFSIVKDENNKMDSSQTDLVWDLLRPEGDVVCDIVECRVGVARLRPQLPRQWGDQASDKSLRFCRLFMQISSILLKFFLLLKYIRFYVLRLNTSVVLKSHLGKFLPLPTKFLNTWSLNSSLGRYVFGSEISYNKAPPRLPGLGC